MKNKNICSLSNRGLWSCFVFFFVLSSFVFILYFHTACVYSVETVCFLLLFSLEIYFGPVYMFLYSDWWLHKYLSRMQNRRFALHKTLVFVSEIVSCVYRMVAWIGSKNRLSTGIFEKEKTRKLYEEMHDQIIWKKNWELNNVNSRNTAIAMETATATVSSAIAVIEKRQ